MGYKQPESQQGDGHDRHIGDHPVLGAYIFLFRFGGGQPAAPTAVMAAVKPFVAEGFAERFPPVAMPGTMDVLGRAFRTNHRIPFSDA